MTPLRALLWAKNRIARHTIASVRRESKLKVAFVSISAVLLWIGLFGFSLLGIGMFRVFGEELIGSGALTVADLVMARLLSVFALALFMLLIFSNVLVSIATLYRSREVSFLVQSPISTASFFLGRFYECVTFSSWASAFLGSPVLLAYGFMTKAPLLYYLALPLFYLPFVIIPAAIGSLLAIFLVHLLVHLRRGHLVAVGAAAVAGLGLYLRGKLQSPQFDNPTIQTLVDTMGQTQSAFLPSFWVSQGVLAAAVGEVGEAVFYLLLLLANALFLVWLAMWAAEGFFYSGWSEWMGGDHATRRGEKGVLDLLDRLLRPVPEPTRSLVIKDMKLFWRDPAQWTQFVLFFGIMAIYIANLGDARSFVQQDRWRGWGTLLNLIASMLILASLTTRFIYPLISLEGRRFWILGLAPVTRSRILWQKFWLSVVSTSVFTVSLAILSAIQLQLDRIAFTLSVSAVAATTVALSGMAVGLGSLYPNFSEDNPSRIVSGMGGTLNFILSMVYVVLVSIVLGLALLGDLAKGADGEPTIPWIVFAAIAVLTAVACGVPMALGRRHLEQLEL